MSNGNFIGLGTPKPQGTVGLGTPKPQGTVGLGTPKPQGTVGLGTPKPEGTVGLGTPKPEGTVGLGTPKPEGTVGLGTPSPNVGLGLPQSQPGVGLPKAEPQAKPAPAEKPVPRKAGIGIDPSAADRVRALLAERGTPEAGLRIRVKGGGCTGMKYDMEFAETPAERDRVFEDHGIRLFVDPKSYIFLIGTVLSYHQGLLESGFKLENPNVKKACGCGESFSV